MPEVKTGQVWQSEDPRDGHRRVEIIWLMYGGQYAQCRNVETGRETLIAIRRLRHTGKRGWRLLEEGGKPVVSLERAVLRPDGVLLQARSFG